MLQDLGTALLSSLVDMVVQSQAEVGHFGSEVERPNFDLPGSLPEEIDTILIFE
jgi:hypothetical protein